MNDNPPQKPPAPEIVILPDGPSAGALAMFAVIAILIHLFIAIAARGQTLSKTPPDEAAQHQAERDQHPERWRQTPWGRQWFHVTPAGEASLQRWDRGQTAHTGSQSKKYLPPQRQEPSPAVIIRELRAEIVRLQERLAALEAGR